MKILKTINFISERMKIRPVTNAELEASRYQYHPYSKEELRDLIKEHRKAQGNRCNLNDIDTSKITDMSDLFKGMDVTFFNGDMSKWDVSNVINMSGLFSNAVNFNGDLSKWNVSKVRNMTNMFYNAQSFNGDISQWDVRDVQKMKGMFFNAISFNQDISSWITSNVTNMDDMFYKARSFRCNISQWYVPKVNSHYDMFSQSPLENDMSKWPKFNV